jgi:hypothetical protein
MKTSQQEYHSDNSHNTLKQGAQKCIETNSVLTSLIMTPRIGVLTIYGFVERSILRKSGIAPNSHNGDGDMCKKSVTSRNYRLDPSIKLPDHDLVVTRQRWKTFSISICRREIARVVGARTAPETGSITSDGSASSSLWIPSKEIIIFLGRTGNSMFALSSLEIRTDRTG